MIPTPFQKKKTRQICDTCPQCLGPKNDKTQTETTTLVEFPTFHYWQNPQKNSLYPSIVPPICSNSSPPLAQFQGQRITLQSADVLPVHRMQAIAHANAFGLHLEAWDAWKK